MGSGKYLRLPGKSGIFGNQCVRTSHIASSDAGAYRGMPMRRQPRAGRSHLAREAGEVGAKRRVRVPPSQPITRFARASTASNSTCAPASASSGWMLSASLCDNPSLHGVKIIAVGTCRAT
jgi:hypothetical protein